MVLPPDLAAKGFKIFDQVRGSLLPLCRSRRLCETNCIQSGSGRVTENDMIERIIEVRAPFILDDRNWGTAIDAGAGTAKSTGTQV
jgi:hypothetical protein